MCRYLPKHIQREGRTASKKCKSNIATWAKWLTIGKVLSNNAKAQDCPIFDWWWRPLYGVHLRTKIIENKIQFEVQKLDYPCQNLVIWIWNRNERSRNSIIRTWSYLEQVETIKGKLDIVDVEVQITSRNSIIRTWSYLEQVETIKGKLDIVDVEVQITIPTRMQITWFELQFTFSTLISHLIVNNATIIFHKIPNGTFNLNLKSRHIFEFQKTNLNSKGSGSKNTQEPSND